jgi:hypothetical protein
LFDLPQELRDRIYELALEPKATFYHSKPEHRPNGFVLPDLTRSNSQSISHTTAGGHDGDQSYFEDRTVPGKPAWFLCAAIKAELSTDPNSRHSAPQAVLSFKVTITAATLLQLSKRVHAEVKEFLRTRGPRYIQDCHKYIAATVHYHCILAPSKFFLEIWSRSRLVLDYPVFGSFWFLNNLPMEIALGLHNIVITQRLARLSNPDDVELWCTPKWERESFFTSFLQQRFPNVDKVRFEIADPPVYDSARQGQRA